MKELITVLLILCFGNYAAQGQLLKKIKDQATKVLEPKSNNSAASGNNNSAENGGSNNSTNSKMQGPPENGNVVFTLAQDETLLYDESKILLKNNKISYAFVVQNKKYEYFLIEDGNRSGPFKEAPIRSLQDTESNEDGGSPNDATVSLGDKKDPVAIQYSKTINGKLFLVFNNKNYGPYDFIPKMIVSPDKKHFFALVTIGSDNAMMAKMGMGNTYMVDEGTLKQKVGSGMAMPTKFSVSENFKQCMATIMEQTTQQILTVTSTNKKEEGTMGDMYSGGSNISFVTDEGDIVTIPAQSPTQVLVNGKEAAAFKVPIKSMHRLFLTPDISKSVYYQQGKIYRANGTEENLAGVLFPKVITTGNETAVYYLKMYKNENGAKDVYLCKKVI